MNIYSAISKNKWKTWLIMSLFVLLILTISYVYGEASGYGNSYAIIAFVFASLTSIGSYFFSDKIILAMSNAKEVSPNDDPELYRIIENLTIGSGTPMPKIYLIDDPALNAFATGRDPKHGVVAITSGLRQTLSKSELEGVMAHELAHIQNYDTRLMAITALLVGFIAILGDIFMRSMFFGGRGRKSAGSIFLLIGIILLVLSPIIASLMQLAISRKREFLADASGALLTRYPDGLASALEKIASDPIPFAKASNATAHLFIVNPFKGKEVSRAFANLFNTHPPIEERIKLLRSM